MVFPLSNRSLAADVCHLVLVFQGTAALGSVSFSFLFRNVVLTAFLILQADTLATLAIASCRGRHDILMTMSNEANEVSLPSQFESGYLLMSSFYDAAMKILVIEFVGEKNIN